MRFRLQTIMTFLLVGAVIKASRTGEPSGTFMRVPYEFRPPTISRIRERLWNPEDKRIFTPHVFGVGWAVNFYQVADRLCLLTRPAEESEESADNEE